MARHMHCLLLVSRIPDTNSYPDFFARNHLYSAAFLKSRYNMKVGITAMVLKFGITTSLQFTLMCLYYKCTCTKEKMKGELNGKRKNLFCKDGR